MATLDSNGFNRPENVRFTDDALHLIFSDGSEAVASLSLFPRLQNASPVERQNWRWIGSRHGINWPDVDEDISVKTLVQESRAVRHRIHQVPALIAELFKITDQLGGLFKGRPFTPDGHLVGSIGEVVAEYVYDLKLEDCSTPQFDARSHDDKRVQIKLTGKNGKSYGIRWSSSLTYEPPDLLLCMKLTDSGFTEVYNGPFPVEILKTKRDTTNGQVPLSVKELQTVNPHLLPQVNSLEEFNQGFTRKLADVA